MNCPHCGNLVPEANFRCPFCHKAVQETVDPSVFRDQRAKRSPLNATVFVFALIIVGVAILAILFVLKAKDKKTAPESAPISEVAQQDNSASNQENTEPVGKAGELKMGRVINKENPGEVIQLEPFVQGDQTTIFDFYSEYCPPCEKMSPWLTELDEKRDDIVVFKVDINRSGFTGIDWGSPLAQQFNLKSIPHFIIYREGGVRDMEGQDAQEYVVQLLQDEGILE